MASFKDLMKQVKSANEKNQSLTNKQEETQISQDKIEVNPEKLYELGFKYYFGQDGYTEDNEKAYEYFKQASDLGDECASAMIGRMYMYGHAVERDIKKAENLLAKGAYKGIAFAQNCLADIFRDEYEDYSSAFRWYKESADSGNSYGMHMTGESYYFGMGVNEDDDNALSYFLKAAELESDISYYYIGCIYDSKENFSEAYVWFKKSADAGYYSGMCGLGKLYYFGNGVETDFSEAYKWLSQAADGDNKDASFLVGHMYEFGNGVSENHSKAMSYYKKAAELGDERAKKAVEYGGWANIPEKQSSDSYDGDVATKIIEIIADKLGVEEDEITMNSSFVNDLGADSLDTVELVMEFEKEFNISIPEEEAERISTVGDAVNGIIQRLK